MKSGRAGFRCQLKSRVGQDKAARKLRRRASQLQCDLCPSGVSKNMSWPAVIDLFDEHGQVLRMPGDVARGICAGEGGGPVAPTAGGDYPVFLGLRRQLQAPIGVIKQSTR